MIYERFAEDVIPPQKGYESDAGLDLFAREDLILGPGEVSERIDLGIGFDIPGGCFGEVKARSSQGKLGIATLGNVVDPSYTGPVHVTLVNHGKEVYEVKKGEKICQIIFQPFLPVLMQEGKLPKKERGSNGHGSTGNKPQA